MKGDVLKHDILTAAVFLSLSVFWSVPAQGQSCSNELLGGYCEPTATPEPVTRQSAMDRGQVHSRDLQLQNEQAEVAPVQQSQFALQPDDIVKQDDIAARGAELSRQANRIENGYPGLSAARRYSDYSREPRASSQTTDIAREQSGRRVDVHEQTALRFRSIETRAEAECQRAGYNLQNGSDAFLRCMSLRVQSYVYTSGDQALMDYFNSLLR